MPVPTGNISGIVSDVAGGGALPGVSVNAMQPMIAISQTVTTGADGSFALESLPVADYAVYFTLPGFAQEMRAVVVQAAVTIQLNVAMNSE